MSTWRRRQMLAAGGKEEPFVWPDTLQKVAYIESPGDMLVNTKISQKYKVLEFDFTFLRDWDDQQMCGARWDLNIAKFDGDLYFKAGGGEYNADFPGGFDYNSHHYLLSSAGLFTYDSYTLFDTYNPNPSTGEDPIILFCRSRGSNMDNAERNKSVKGRFSGNFQIRTLGGATVWEGVPVRTLDSWVNAEGDTVPTGTAGFFDMVSKKLFSEYYGNSLTAGPDITD